MKRKLKLDEIKNSENPLEEAYRQAYPEWDNVSEVVEYPRVHPDTSTELYKIMIQFDKSHRSTFPGGVWMNWGFATDENCEPGYVYPGKVVMK